VSHRAAANLAIVSEERDDTKKLARLASVYRSAAAEIEDGESSTSINEALAPPTTGEKITDRMLRSDPELPAGFDAIATAKRAPVSTFNVAATAAWLARRSALLTQLHEEAVTDVEDLTAQLLGAFGWVDEPGEHSDRQLQDAADQLGPKARQRVDLLEHDDLRHLAAYPLVWSFPGTSTLSTLPANSDADMSTLLAALDARSSAMRLRDAADKVRADIARIDEQLNSARDHLRAAQTIRTTRQRVALAQRSETEAESRADFENLVTTAGVVLIAPGLVAGIYGANASPLAGESTPATLTGLLLIMTAAAVIGGTTTQWIRARNRSSSRGHQRWIVGAMSLSVLSAFAIVIAGETVSLAKLERALALAIYVPMLFGSTLRLAAGASWAGFQAELQGYCGGLPAPLPTERSSAREQL
jgi:hypothetical protein